MGAKIWSEEEDRILEENYPIMGKKVVDLLPGRSIMACTSRANMLNITSTHKWTEEDDAILREKYPKVGGNVGMYLNGKHSAASCYQRAYCLRICKTKRREVRNERG